MYKSIFSKYVCFFLGILFTVMLCGCGVNENSAPPSKYEVEKAVQAEVFGEHVVLDHVEKTDEKPRKDIYYYKSEDRDLEFTAWSYVYASDIGIGGSPIYVYSRKIEVNYRDGVERYYEPKLDDIFCDGTKSGKRYKYSFKNYEELAEIIAVIQEAEECYSEEKQYHDANTWRESHPIASVTIEWVSDNTDADGNPITYDLISTGYHIWADSDSDLTFEIIAGSYAGAVVSGHIDEDETIPASVLSLGHKDKLEKVIVNGTEMTEELSFVLGVTPSVVHNGVFTAEYVYEYHCYMMPIDPGCGTKKGRCHPLQALVKAAGGTGGDECKNNGKESWEINGDSFVITAERDTGKSSIKDISLTKNGKPMDITYTLDNEYTRSSDMILVSVEDLAEMLGLSVTIDEENGMVVFE